MEVEIVLGLASKFCYYDQNTMRLTTVSNLLTNEFVGTYAIGVTASIKSETYSESHKDRFTLTVLP